MDYSFPKVLNESIITWHKPEEAPPEEENVLVMLKDCEGEISWEMGYKMDGIWYSNCTGLEIEREILVWGIFELPNIEEVVNANSVSE